MCLGDVMENAEFVFVPVLSAIASNIGL